MPVKMAKQIIISHATVWCANKTGGLLAFAYLFTLTSDAI